MGECGWKCVGTPHPNTLSYTSRIPLATSLPLTPTHFSTHPIHFPTPLPTLFHSSHVFSYSSPHPNTLPYTPHIPHTSSHSSPHLPLHPKTLPHSPHIFPHSLDHVAKLPCDDVTLINLTGLWKSPIKFFNTTRNLKSCFGLGNVNFRCMKVWRSYWQLLVPQQS